MNTEELRDKIRKLPPVPEAKPPYWDYWRGELRSDILTKEPETFMYWPTIYHTMLMNHLPITRSLSIVQPEIEEPRCVDAFAPPKFTRPEDMYADKYSRAMIEQAAHIYMWEQNSHKDVDDLEHIVEFGGGFGAMALLVNRLGFKGKYIIYDYPEMCLFQEWFLDQHGVGNVLFITDIKSYFMETDLLIAIDSISETPIETRDLFWAHVQMKNCIFRYSPQWESYNNQQYFMDFISTYGLEFFGWDAEGWVSKSIVGWSL